MKNSQKNMILIIVILLIVLAIFGINTLKNDSELINPDIVQCISEKSILYVSKTCGHCARQKDILSDCLDRLEIVDCTDEIEKCIENGITQVPTWVINGQKYAGVKTIDEIIELCGCAK